MDLIEEYLVHSYLYYVLGEIVITDYAFDRICREMSANWTSLESPFKSAVTVYSEEEIEWLGRVEFKGQDGDSSHDYPKEIVRQSHVRLEKWNKEVKEWKELGLT